MYHIYLYLKNTPFFVSNNVLISIVIISNSNNKINIYLKFCNGETSLSKDPNDIMHKYKIG